MKNLLLTLIALITLASCQKDYYKDDLIATQLELTEANSEIEALLLVIKQKNQEIIDLNADLEANAVRIAKLESDVLVLNEFIVDLEERIAELEALLEEERKKNRDLTVLNNELTIANADLILLVNNTQLDNEAKDAQIKELNVYIDTLITQIDELVEIINNFEVQIEVLTDELDVTNAILAAIQEFIAETLVRIGRGDILDSHDTVDPEFFNIVLTAYIQSWNSENQGRNEFTLKYYNEISINNELRDRVAQLTAELARERAVTSVNAVTNLVTETTVDWNNDGDFVDVFSETVTTTSLVAEDGTVLESSNVTDRVISVDNTPEPIDPDALVWGDDFTSASEVDYYNGRIYLERADLTVWQYEYINEDGNGAQKNIVVRGGLTLTEWAADN